MNKPIPDDNESIKQSFRKDTGIQIEACVNPHDRELTVVPNLYWEVLLNKHSSS